MSKVAPAAGARMLLRAFDPLPEPHYLRVLPGYWDTHFADVPENCAAAVENLTRAGVYIPEDDGAFQPDEPMTREALVFPADRIHAYLGASPQNDFCNTVNHEYYYETATEIGEDVGVGRYQPYFVGSNEPFFVGSMGTNQDDLSCQQPRLAKVILAGQPSAQRPLLCQSVQKLYPVSFRGSSHHAA